jgi:hypothetical protein
MASNASRTDVRRRAAANAPSLVATEPFDSSYFAGVKIVGTDADGYFAVALPASSSDAYPALASLDLSSSRVRWREPLDSNRNITGLLHAQLPTEVHGLSSQATALQFLTPTMARVIGKYAVRRIFLLQPHRLTLSLPFGLQKFQTMGW